MEPKIAVVGAGKWGRNLVRNFKELGVLGVVHDPRMGYHANYLADDINGVVIATPNDTHYQLAKECLLAGKDVFVEKPMTLNVKEAEDLVQLADDYQRVLMVGHIMLYHPAIVKLRELVGKTYYVTCHRYKQWPGRKDDVLWTLAPHDVALVLSILGIPTDTKSGQSEKTAWINMEFGNARGDVFASWDRPTGYWLCAMGERTVEYDGKLVVNGENIPFPDDEPLKLECQDFLHCVNTREKPKADGQNGLEVVRILCEASS